MARDPIRRKKWQDKYKEDNKERLRAKARAYKEKNKEKINQNTRDWYLMKLYGITREEYNRLFEKQKGECAICGKHQKEFQKSLSVDHCHDTGKIRGLLCNNCNLGIGKLRDCPKLLEKALSYLKQNQV